MIITAWCPQQDLLLTSFQKPCLLSRASPSLMALDLGNNSAFRTLSIKTPTIKYEHSVQWLVNSAVVAPLEKERSALKQQLQYGRSSTLILQQKSRSRTCLQGRHFSRSGKALMNCSRYCNSSVTNLTLSFSVISGRQRGRICRNKSGSLVVVALTVVYNEQ